MALMKDPERIYKDMSRERKLIKVIGMMMCVLLLVGSAKLQVYALNNENITVYVDCNGGTYLTVGHPEFNYYDAEFVVPSGHTISDADHTIIGDSPTAIGKDFLGWNVYDAPGNMLGSLWSAEQVNSYSITNTTRFVAQWKDRDPAYKAKDIYFLLWDHNKDAADYTAKVSVIYDGVTYSGYGFLRISEDIYSVWNHSFDVKVEGNGHYTRENRTWVEYSTGTFSLYDFTHSNNVSFQMSETASGSDSSPVVKSINEFIYSVRDVEPTITVTDSLATEVVPIRVDIYESSLPANFIVRSEKYVSGTQVDAVAVLIQNTVGGETKAIYDIKIADASGNAIHDTGANVRVDIDLPGDYQVSEDKQLVVYYVSADGKLEACTTTLHSKDDGTQYVTFETNHFSVYAVAEVDKSTTEPTDEPASQPTTEPTNGSTTAPTKVPEANSATGEGSTGDVEVTPQEGEEQQTISETTTTEKSEGFSGIGVWIGIGVSVLTILVIVCAVAKRKKKASIF